jgi:hypothetical protein
LSILNSLPLIAAGPSKRLMTLLFGGMESPSNLIIFASPKKGGGKERKKKLFPTTTIAFSGESSHWKKRWKRSVAKALFKARNSRTAEGKNERRELLQLRWINSRILWTN